MRPTLLDFRYTEQGYVEVAVIAALDLLELAFIGLVGSMTALAGLFALYVVIQIFRNPARRRSP